MGEQTAISWTDHTFNPWWGCQKVSPACANCYAETFSKRVGLQVWGPESERRFFGDKHWAEPRKWNADALKAGVRRRVFCASMADVFEDRADLVEPRLRLFELIEKTPHLDWLLLTKRPDLMLEFFAGTSGAGLSAPALPNLWAGTTVENQQYADERIPFLLQVPAVVRFLSVEPMLGPIELPPDALMELDWVIAGGESGAKHRPSNPDWFRSLRDQCQAAGVYFHFKQWGGLRPKTNGRLLDGREWNEFPATTLSS